MVAPTALYQPPYQFPKAAITKDLKPGGFKQQKVMLSELEFPNEGAGVGASWRLWGGIGSRPLSWLPVVASRPWHLLDGWSTTPVSASVSTRCSLYVSLRSQVPSVCKENQFSYFEAGTIQPSTVYFRERVQPDNMTCQQNNIKFNCYDKQPNIWSGINLIPWIWRHLGEMLCDNLAPSLL